MITNINEPTTKSLSHEAKSHLTVVYGYIQLLQNTISASNFDKNKIDSLLNKTLHSCNDLSKILEALDDKVSDESTI